MPDASTSTPTMRHASTSTSGIGYPRTITPTYKSSNTGTGDLFKALMWQRVIDDRLRSFTKTQKSKRKRSTPRAAKEVLGLRREIKSLRRSLAKSPRKKTTAQSRLLKKNQALLRKQETLLKKMSASLRKRSKVVSRKKTKSRGRKRTG